MNTFLLTCEANVRGYSANYWLTFKQAKERGGAVKKGEKSTPVVFWKILEFEKEDAPSPAGACEDDGAGKQRVPLLKYYNVFNVGQCEGLTVPAVEDAGAAPREHDPVIQCKAILAAMPQCPPIVYEGTRAFYSIRRDQVTLPPAERFSSREEFYGTLFHELVHATGHESRLNRPGVTEAAPFGSPSYAREELVAEMGSAFLCGRAGIDVPPLMENSAAYLANWIQVLRADAKVAVFAASQAQKASDSILGVKREGQERS